MNDTRFLKKEVHSENEEGQLLGARAHDDDEEGLDPALEVRYKMIKIAKLIANVNLKVINLFYFREQILS
jgi:hypothetical protein